MELDHVQDVEVGQSSNSEQAQSASESYTPTDPDAAESFVFRSGRRGGLVPSTGSRYSKKSEESSANYYEDDDEDEIRHAKVVLQLLQVIMFHRVAMLQVPNNQCQRTVIGDGASCTVEEGRLPLENLLDSLCYHIPKLRPLFHRGNFVDHNGISWAPDTATAFKVIALKEDSEIQKSLRLEELTSEVRVLSHGPLQTHPHIINLLGVAWTRMPSPDGIKADTEDRLTPAALLELTPHGSLLKFLHKPKSPVSMETKLKLCNDVLLAIQVNLPLSRLYCYRHIPIILGITCLQDRSRRHQSREYSGIQNRRRF